MLDRALGQRPGATVGVARDMHRCQSVRKCRKRKPSKVLAFSGASQEVPMFWVFVTLLWAAMLLSPFVLLYLFLPSGRACPRCAAETVPIRSRLLLPARRLACLRWCMGCGWEGLARTAVLRRPVAPEDVGGCGVVRTAINRCKKLFPHAN